MVVEVRLMVGVSVDEFQSVVVVVIEVEAPVGVGGKNWTASRGRQMSVGHLVEHYWRCLRAFGPRKDGRLNDRGYD
jgi:hypothetical protein